MSFRGVQRNIGIGADHPHLSPWYPATRAASTVTSHQALAEVRDAAGHAHVSITSAYLHVAVEDDEVGELFRIW